MLKRMSYTCGPCPLDPSHEITYETAPGSDYPTTWKCEGGCWKLDLGRWNTEIVPKLQARYDAEQRGRRH